MVLIFSLHFSASEKRTSYFISKVKRLASIQAREHFALSEGQNPGCMLSLHQNAALASQQEDISENFATHLGATPFSPPPRLRRYAARYSQWPSSNVDGDSHQVHLENENVASSTYTSSPAKSHTCTTHPEKCILFSDRMGTLKITMPDGQVIERSPKAGTRG